MPNWRIVLRRTEPGMHRRSTHADKMPLRQSFAYVTNKNQTGDSTLKCVMRMGRPRSRYQTHRRVGVSSNAHKSTESGNQSGAALLTLKNVEYLHAAK